MISQEIYYYSDYTIISVIWHLILFTNFVQTFSQNNTSFDFPLFYNYVRALRMSYSMTSTKIEFDLAPYLEMIISAIL